METKDDIINIYEITRQKYHENYTKQKIKKRIDVRLKLDP